MGDMETPTVTIAGRPVPSWTGQALWTLILLLALAFIVQLENLPATAQQAPAAAPAPAEAVPAIQTGLEPAPRVAASSEPVMLELDRAMNHGDYVWNDQGVPAGRVDILVDIGAQTLHVFRAGHEIGRAVILYGTEENPTPFGTFTITQKKVYHESNLYEAIMPYMMRLTDDGIAIHGSEVEYGKASRGCIGVPDEFAALLFGQARIGDRVRIVAGNAPAPGSTEA